MGAVAAWNNIRRGENAPWDLLLCCAAVPILAYFVLGLFADDTRFRAHWPLPGYLPLLVVLPAFAARGAAVALAARVHVCASALGSTLAFAYLGMAAIPGGADVLARMKAFPQQFVGWREAAAQTRALLAQPRFADSTLVADNFMLAAELDFALGGKRVVYTLDHPINAKHGRAPQLAMWGRDEAGLRALGMGHRILLVVEPGARRERERAAWLDTLCSRVGDLAPVARLDSYAGRKRYRWYAGVVTKCRKHRIESGLHRRQTVIHGISISNSRSSRHSAISGSPINAVGSSDWMRSNRAMPSPSHLKLPAQSSGFSRST